MKWIDRCIKSITDNGCTNIIVIDNASTDATVSFISKNFPFVDIVRSEKNLGFGAANNIGIKKAVDTNCDYVFLVNQDVYVKPDVLRRLYNRIELDPEAGIISPVHLNGNATNFDKNFLSNLLSETNIDFITDLYFKNVPDVYEVLFVNAAAWFVSIKCIRKVGLFDSIFFHYGEDNNYCQRVRYHKYKILISTQAEIMHDREDRKGGIRPEFLKQHILNSILIDLCDPAKNTANEIRIAQRKLIKVMFASLIKLNLRNLNDAKNKYLFINKQKDRIMASTQRNREFLNQKLV